MPNPFATPFYFPRIEKQQLTFESHAHTLALPHLGSLNEMKIFGITRRRVFFAAVFCAHLVAPLLTRAEVTGIKWAKQYDGTNYPSIFGTADSFDQGRAITVDSAGNALVAARSNGFHVSKYSGIDGALLWEQRIGTGSNYSDAALAIAADAKGDVVATGVLGTDFYTAKYAGSDGHLLWQQRYNGIGNDSDGATNLALDPEGNVIVTGHTIAFGKAKEYRTFFGDIIYVPAPPDIYTAKYDGANGHLLWEQRYDGPAQESDYPADLGVDPHGNVFMTGYSSTRLRPDGLTDVDIYTVKYAGPTGKLLWEKRADGGGYDYPTGLVVDRFGNVVVNGSLGAAQTVEASYTVKYSGSGRVLWERKGTSGSIVTLGPIAADSEGDIAVAGSYSYAAPEGNYAQGLYTAKFAGNNGRLLWEQKNPGSSGGQLAGAGEVKFNLAGNVVIGGAAAISTNPYKWRLYAAEYSGADGKIRWEKLFSVIGPQYEETFGGLALDAEGSAFLTGTLYPRPTGDDIDMFVVKLAPTGQLLNVSSRLQVGTGENVAIAGIIVVGPENAPKNVLIRGLGPSLAEAGIPGALHDPVLELRMANGTSVRNNDWKENQRREIEATGLAPSKDSESAIVATLPAGAHTVVLRGNNGGAGIGLVELYDLDKSGLTNLANISTRGQVGTGDNVMISGFIAGGPQSTKILVRALGPSLTALGVSGALPDPTLELHDQNGTAFGNDDWRSTQEAEIAATGAAPGNNKESAILAILAPGPYTAVLRGAQGTTGVAIIEAYNLQ